MPAELKVQLCVLSIYASKALSVLVILNAVLAITESAQLDWTLPMSSIESVIHRLVALDHMCFRYIETNVVDLPEIVTVKKLFVPVNRQTFFKVSLSRRSKI